MVCGWQRSLVVSGRAAFVKVLAGDIGGTKTLLRIVEWRDAAFTVIHEARYPSQHYAHFETLFMEFMQAAGERARGVVCAALGVAGPVRHKEGRSRAEITNLPWRLDNAGLSDLCGIPRVYLINDFEAIGFGLGLLAVTDQARLQEAPIRNGATRLIVGAGTGLGVALQQQEGAAWRVSASQGGHMAFAPSDEIEDALLHYWRPRLVRMSWEHAVSGPGIVRIYEFLYHRLMPADDVHYRAVLASTDPAAAIAEGAQRGEAVCVQTLVLFTRLYGRFAGDLALVTLPFGGIYLAGGIAPKLLDCLRNGHFLSGFRDKGPMTPLMTDFPVTIITDPTVGVRGAAVYATLHAT